MVPDKIYIHRTIHLGLLSASEIDITGQDEQYIRKDALLELVRLAYGKLSMNSFDVQNVFEELIDKIK